MTTAPILLIVLGSSAMLLHGISTELYIQIPVFVNLQVANIYIYQNVHPNLTSIHHPSAACVSISLLHILFLASWGSQTPSRMVSVSRSLLWSATPIHPKASSLWKLNARHLLVTKMPPSVKFDSNSQ